MIDLIQCHRALYFHDFVAKVLAEVTATFSTTTQKLHQNIRPKLAEQWKAWAAKNIASMRLTATTSAPTNPAVAAAADEYLANDLED